MREAIKSAPRFDEEVAGTPVEAHGYIVTPFARMRGMVSSQESEQGRGRFGWAVTQPARMTVQTLHTQDLTAAVREVRLVDVEGQATKALVVIAVLVALFGLLIPVLLNRPDRSSTV